MSLYILSLFLLRLFESSLSRVVGGKCLYLLDIEKSIRFELVNVDQYRGGLEMLSRDQ